MKEPSEGQIREAKRSGVLDWKEIQDIERQQQVVSDSNASV